LKIIETNRKDINSINRLIQEIGYNIVRKENEKEEFTVVKYGRNGYNNRKNSDFHIINENELNKDDKIFDMNLNINNKDSVYIIDDKNNTSLNNHSLEILENYIP